MADQKSKEYRKIVVHLMFFMGVTHWQSPYGNIPKLHVM